MVARSMTETPAAMFSHLGGDAGGGDHDLVQGHVDDRGVVRRRAAGCRRMPARLWWRTAAWRPGSGACGPPYVWDRTRLWRRSRCWDDSRLRVFSPAASVHPARGTQTVSTPAGLLARGSSPGSAFSFPCRNNGDLEPGSPLQLRGQPRIDRGCGPGVAFPFQPLRATCVWTQTSAMRPIRKTTQYARRTE